MRLGGYNEAWLSIRLKSVLKKKKGKKEIKKKKGMRQLLAPLVDEGGSATSKFCHCTFSARDF